MVTEYDIQGPTRVCAATGRDLKPGDPFCAVLADRDGRFVRTDYAAAAWPGPPSDAIAHWTGKVPPADRPNKPVVNDDLLMDCFTRLAGTTEPGQVRFRYVVALLLMRRKRLKFDDAGRDHGHDVLNVRDAKTGERYDVADPRLSADETKGVQDEVFRVLGWDG